MPTPSCFKLSGRTSLLPLRFGPSMLGISRRWILSYIEEQMTVYTVPPTYLLPGLSHLPPGVLEFKGFLQASLTMQCIQYI